MSAGSRLPGTPDPMHRWEGFGGVTIAADSWGDPDGPLILLLHGGGQTRHAWKGTGETLGEAGYRVVAYDARGHGDSDWAPDGDYGQDAHLGDLLCVLDALGDNRPVLVGASMGGGTSLEAVGEDRVDATALVLVDIAHKIELEGVDHIRDFMHQKPTGFESLQEVADAIAGYQPHRSRPRNLDGLAKNVRLGEDGRYHWHWDPGTWQGNVDEDEREVRMKERETRLESAVRHLTLPTLLVRGALSDLLSEEGAQSFLALAPHAEYVNVAGAAHMVAGDRNDIFANAVIDFLTRVVPVDGEPKQAPHPLQSRNTGPADDTIDVP